MTEADGRKWLKRKLARFDVQFQSIESGGTGIGIPDAFLQSDHGHLWLELKIGYYVAQGIRVVFRPGQLPWIQTNARLGGSIGMLMFVPHEGDYDDFSWWLLKGADVKPFYFLEELTRKGVGFLTGQTPPELVYEALFNNH